METEIWPSLPLDGWKDTYATLHMWSQVVGKFALRYTSYVNHWWNVAFHVTSRGLRSGPIPYRGSSFDFEFDFIDHLLTVRKSDGGRRDVPLIPRSVADFYQELSGVMSSLGLPTEIDREPKEVPNPIPFDQDRVHASYDRDAANRHWRILVQVDRVLKKFRGEFIGKCSPVHFFWGSFDLCVTRFSGRTAPPRPEADHITQLAYSHEVSSCGFWPGSGNILEPAFYSYTAPEPAGFSRSGIAPDSAFYNSGTKGFILRYEDVRRSSDPDAMLLKFCRTTYDAAARFGGWDAHEVRAA